MILDVVTTKWRHYALLTIYEQTEHTLRDKCILNPQYAQLISLIA